MMKAFFLNTLAWAEEGAHQAAEAGHGAAAHGGGHEGIPWDSIFIQSFNFLLLVGLLIYLLRKTVKAHFTHRANDYQQMVARADAAKREAEQGKMEIKNRLDKLEAGASDSLNQARAEAAAMKVKLQAEAKALSAKVDEDAKRTTQVELDKAKDELRRELLESALQASSNTLRTGLSSGEQKRLQDEFAKKIQVVGG